MLKKSELIHYAAKAVMAAICLFAFLSANASDMKLTNWKAYSAIIDVKSASIDSKNRIWACSPGGVFCYDPSTDDLNEFRNIDALLSLDISTVRCNVDRKEIYIGESNGNIDICTEDFKFSYITDIKGSGFANAKINDIIFTDKLAYIAGGFGLAVFDLDKRVFVETAQRIGNYQTNTEISQIQISEGKIWAATGSGLASCELKSVLSDPSSWKTYPLMLGMNYLPLGGLKITSVQGNPNPELYAFGGKIVYKLVLDSLIQIIEIGDNVLNLVEYEGNILIGAQYRILNLNGSDAAIQASKKLNNIISPTNKSVHQLLYCFSNEGIGMLHNRTEKVYKPNSPHMNLFLDIDVDKNGNVWATGDYKSSNGIMEFGNGKWQSFLQQSNPEIVDNGYHKVRALKDGRVVVSNWGKEVLVASAVADGFKFERITQKSGAPFTTAVPVKSGEDDYVIIGESAEDSQGNLWFVNYGQNTPGPILVGMTKDKKFYGYNNCNNSNSRSYVGLAVDFFGTKWVASFEADRLVYYNENKTPDNKSDDICGGISTDQYPQLGDNAQSALAVDKTGMVWIGTQSGLSVIMNPSAVLSHSSLLVRNIKLLGRQTVTDIMVDALNNKWVATSAGVWVMNSDATKVLAIFTTDNTPLPTNQIVALANNPNTGQIYFGTRQGLFEATSLSVQAGDSYDISCYPQPFVPQKDEAMIIDGLAGGSEVRILTIDGELVHNFITNSRKANWDGRDNDGKLVSSGVYLVVCFSADSKASAVAKIAVINK